MRQNYQMHYSWKYFGSDDGEKDDLIRIYVPLEISKALIIRKIEDVYNRYGYLTDDTESDISSEVYWVISHLEIYDQVWSKREGTLDNGHSAKATEVVQEIIKILMINEGCAELFPYNLVEELQEDYNLHLVTL